MSARSWTKATPATAQKAATEAIKLEVVKHTEAKKVLGL
jgi:hypothetical protein